MYNQFQGLENNIELSTVEVANNKITSFKGNNNFMFPYWKKYENPNTFRNNRLILKFEYEVVIIRIFYAWNIQNSIRFVFIRRYLDNRIMVSKHWAVPLFAFFLKENNFSY